MKNKAPVIIIALALLIVGGFYVMRQTNDSTSENGQNPSNTMGGMMVEDNSIAVSSQGETNLLFTSMVELEAPGYVVVHEDSNGQPGRILGVSGIIGPGMVHGAPVSLSRSTTAGEKIYAMLHKDNGDRTFSLADDQPVQSNQGGPIMMIVEVESGNATQPSDMSI